MRRYVIYQCVESMQMEKRQMTKPYRFVSAEKLRIHCVLLLSSFA